MKFAVLSDIHYISRKMMPDIKNADLLMKPAICETALRMVSELDGIDTVLFTGDLTNEGDRASHLDFIELLKALQAKGKKVYVTTATHDFHHHRAYVNKYSEKVSYCSAPWAAPFFDTQKADYKKCVSGEFSHLSDEECAPELEDACSPEELWEMYRPFGPQQAISACEPAHCYCVELDDSTWCLMLNDNFRNVEATGDISATYTPACFKWIDKTVKEAHEKGKFIFACTHHPLLPPVPAYKIGASSRNMRSPVVGHTLADIGIPLVFSGHSHFCDVGFMRSDNGNLLCDITTPSVRFYPPQYRIVELDGKASKIKIESVDIKTVDGFDLGDITLKEYIRRDFTEEYARKVAALKPPFNKVVSTICVKHLYPICKNTCKLNKYEYESIKNMRMFDILIELALNMQGGDGKYTPDTPVYKFMMGLSATLDSLIETQPFYDVRKKLLKGYTVSEFIEPMLFNNFIPDGNAEFDFTVEPEARYNTPDISNNAGDVVMALLCILVIPLSKLLPGAAIAALPAAVILKKKNRQKNLLTPERY